MRNDQLTACSLRLVAYICFMKILMVCLGNICRSPLAEGILQDKAFKAGLSWSVESAGTQNYHTGEPPHPLSQKVAKINGIDICHQRARKFVAGDFEVYDKIYALAGDVLDEIGIGNQMKSLLTERNSVMYLGSWETSPSRSDLPALARRVATESGHFLHNLGLCHDNRRGIVGRLQL